jgi:hypothetical protein
MLKPVPLESPDCQPPNMDRNNILSTLLMLGGAFVCIAIGELLPPLRKVHQWTEAHKGVCLAVCAVLLVAGLFVFIGTIIEMSGRLQRSLKEEEVEEMAVSFRENQPGVVWRKWAYRFHGSGQGGSLQIGLNVAVEVDAFDII